NGAMAGHIGRPGVRKLEDCASILAQRPVVVADAEGVILVYAVRIVALRGKYLVCLPAVRAVLGVGRLDVMVVREGWYLPDHIQPLSYPGDIYVALGVCGGVLAQLGDAVCFAEARRRGQYVGRRYVLLVLASHLH